MEHIAGCMVYFGRDCNCGAVEVSAVRSDDKEPILKLGDIVTIGKKEKYEVARYISGEYYLRPIKSERMK